MQYTNIRGLSISKLTLGTAQLGMAYGIANKCGKLDSTACFKILRTAAEKGVNSFDTAELYGDSEEVLGNYFSAIECSGNNNVITTKFKIDSVEDSSPGNIEKQVYKHVEKSLQHLKIRKIPVYMLHSARDISIYESVVPLTLEKLKKEQLIGKAGVSVYTSDDVDEMLKDDIFEVVQVPMNIMDHILINSGAVKRLKEKNIIVFVRSIFLQGLFFKNLDELTGNLVDAIEPLAQLKKLAEHDGLSTAQLALSYIRDIEGITSLVIGAETPEQVIENIKLIDAPPIVEKTRDKIDRLFSGIPEEILNPVLWNILDR